MNATETGGRNAGRGWASASSRDSTVVAAFVERIQGACDAHAMSHASQHACATSSSREGQAKPRNETLCVKGEGGWLVRVVKRARLENGRALSLLPKDGVH